MKITKICIYICCFALLLSCFTACSNGGKDESSVDSSGSEVLNSEVLDSDVVSSSEDKSSERLRIFRNVLRSSTFSYSKTVDDSTSYYIKTPEAVYLNIEGSAQLDIGGNSYYIDNFTHTAYKYEDPSAINTDSISDIVTGLKAMTNSGSEIVHNEPCTFETYAREYFSEYENPLVTVETTFYFDKNDVLKFIKTKRDGNENIITINVYSDTLSDEESAKLSLSSYTLSTKSAEKYLGH